MIVTYRYKKLFGLISIVGIIFLLWLISYVRALMYSFNGIVQNVSYDVQHTPTVTINGIEYNLVYNNWGHYQDTIEKGDSMIKIKGETYIKLIKRNKRDTVNFLHK